MAEGQVTGNGTGQVWRGLEAPSTDREVSHFQPPNGLVRAFEGDGRGDGEDDGDGDDGAAPARSGEAWRRHREPVP